jgi:hypothetical protein
MKKIYFTLGLSVLLFGAYAQQFKINPNKKAIPAINSNDLVKTQGTMTDTLVPISILDSTCGKNLYYYSVDNNAPIDTGYVFGTNSFTVAVGAGVTYLIQNAKSAEKYTVTGAATVNGILVATPKAYSSASTSSVTAEIFSENSTTKAPNASLGSASKSLNSITAGKFNLISFSTPVSVAAGNFFASVATPTLGGVTKDTMAISSTAFGCSTNDSLSWIYQSVTSGTTTITKYTGWYSVKFDYNANVDLAIYPIVTMTTLGINSVSKGGLSLFAAYPNPANNTVNINFSLDKTSQVDIEIYDIFGKVVKTIHNGSLSTGTNLVAVDISNLEAGSYLYSINAGGNKMFSRFMVTR